MPGDMIMSHWIPPEMRGIYNDPANMPPPPEPREMNNFQTRIVRIEDYLVHAWRDRMRAEKESLKRDTEIDRRLAVLEDLLKEWLEKWRSVTLAVQWGWAAAKFLAAALAIALWINGGVTLTNLARILSWAGLPLP